MDSGLQSDTIADISTWSKIVEQRQEERIDFRTIGSIYPLADEGTDPVSAPIKVWTMDVSTTGALIRSYSELDSNCERVLIQLVMPQLNELLIEGTIVRSKQSIAKYINGKEKESYLYGVNFTRIIEKVTISEGLLNAPHVSVESETAPSKVDQSTTTVEKLNGDVESSLPVLSAIGLIVVYAALLLIF